ncbi:hypothetical protein FRC02_003607 [Tulasnella sp. 418]|nr:hypothetical protein FRC02_003607 [Tulasnella sp. 418]
MSSHNSDVVRRKTGSGEVTSSSRLPRRTPSAMSSRRSPSGKIIKQTGYVSRITISSVATYSNPIEFLHHDRTVYSVILNVCDSRATLEPTSDEQAFDATQGWPRSLLQNTKLFINSV